ncbi:MAG: alanine--tRNA ligase [Firmicutes bacterium]|nr:alanine--tRNA ligase [Bacillota bacterium]
MTGSEIREKFLQFFEQKEHQRLPSASLIPENDPSILWTAAGMVPFKPFFTGAAKPVYKRATTCQKCLRTPDIEEVGKTARHHTFFEMLGNFSFGDYFKEEAISWAWEFVTEHLGMPADKLWISIYLNDDEAFEIWHKKVGIPEDRIVRMGKEENFWEIGVGPCGPCSELYIDLGEERGCGSDDCAPGCDCDRFLEIWNLVFIQYFKDEQGEYSPLTNKGIDTGMGLERVASVLQKVPTNFDTDLLREIMDHTAGLIGVKYGAGPQADMALKVIADHTRAITFAISDGALPSNEGRGYVVRRLLRRAVRFGRLLGKEEPFLFDVATAVIRQMQDAYPELLKSKDNVTRIVQTEEKRFGETLVQGSEILNKLINEAKQAGKDTIDGNDVFKLYDTYGFPVELTREIAEEQGLKIDEDAFKAYLEEQRQRARNARQETEYLSQKDALFSAIRDDIGETSFVGYRSLSAQAKVLCIVNGDERVESAGAGEEVFVILDTTPCYAESGGQVADKGKIYAPGLEVEIKEVLRPVEGLNVHLCSISNGTLNINDSVQVEVEANRRKNIARNHSATHLLHKALKEVLGDHANQAGSLVEPDRLRFDFTHFSALSQEEIVQIEKIVNQAIMADLPVETFETSMDEAKSLGAAALFGEKYGDRVRVIKMGEFSIELCGGTHLNSTSQIGMFKLQSEGSVGSGIRRIEAVTGEGALRHAESREQQLAGIAAILKTSPSELVSRVGILVKEHRELERELESLRARLAKFEVESLLNNSVDVEGVKVLAEQANAGDMDSLRAMVDLLRDKMGSGVIVLGTSSDQHKVNLVAGVSKDLTGKGLHAGKIIKEIASVVGGGGGGRPDMAQAGGKDPSRLQEALDKVSAVVKQQLG